MNTTANSEVILSLSFTAFLVLFSLWLGHYKIDLFLMDETAKNIIVLNIRIPRIILSSLSGGILGVGGLILQVIFKNPLVDSKMIGVSTSVALAGVWHLFWDLVEFT